MPSSILSSRVAREKWRELLDLAHRGDDAVIERNGKPVAALIPFEDYEALQDELDELRAARRAQAALEAWRRDPSQGRPYSEIRAELVKEGLLDD